MKKIAFPVIVLFLAAAFLAGPRAAAGEEGWKPTKSIEWVCLSSPGGGSDIFTRTIIGIINKYNLVPQTITVVYQTDGGGVAGQLRVAATDDGGHTLMTYNLTEIESMILHTDNRVKDLTPVAVMASDSVLLCVTPQAKFQDPKKMIEEVKSGESLVVAGSKRDDEQVYEAFAKAVDIMDNSVYLIHDSTADAITAALGGHADVCVVKPAASSEFVRNGDLIPFVSFTETRLDPPFDKAPVVTELGDYPKVLFVLSRAIAGPKAMPPEALKFWDGVFRKVTESPEWKKDYLDRYLLRPDFKPSAEALKAFTDYQTMFLKRIGKDK